MALFVAVTISPFSIVLIVPVLLVSFYLYDYSIRAGLQIKRLESVALSPILAHMTNTLDGLTTIRAAKKSSLLIAENHKHLDRNFMANLLFETYNRWLGVRLDLITWLFTLLILFICFLLKGSRLDNLNILSLSL